MRSVAEFARVNTASAGITLVDARSWITAREAKALSDAFPDTIPLYDSKYVLFDSRRALAERDRSDSAENHYFRTPKLQQLAAKMRQAMLETLPEKQRFCEGMSPWAVLLARSNGAARAGDDQHFHVHSWGMVATLSLLGPGSVAKVAAEDFSSLGDREVGQKADAFAGHVFEAPTRWVSIFDRAHFANGGLHAAPVRHGSYPERFTLIVTLFTHLDRQTR